MYVKRRPGRICEIKVERDPHFTTSVPFMNEWMLQW